MAVPMPMPTNSLVMRKVAAWFFIVFGLALLVASTSGPIMHYLSTKRAPLTGWAGVHHLEGAGDLVSMAYLDKEKTFLEAKDYRFIRSTDTGSRDIDLYVYGDSYVREIPDSVFSHIHHYHFGRRDYTDLVYTLDPHKKNILLIEDAERFIRPYFQYLAIFDHVRKGDPALSFMEGSAGGNQAMLGIKADLFFNPGINHNLEFNLFGYAFIDPVKLFKASATYQLFGRAAGDVVVSENGKYLFLRQTVAAHDLLSSYNPIGRPELRLLIDHLNTIYEHYKQEGFDEVYLSIIPNPVSILQPNDYNGLIPALQKDPSLKMPTIDCYSVFAGYPEPGSLYRVGDTHWNNKGLQVWIGLVNQLLNNQAAR